MIDESLKKRLKNKDESAFEELCDLLSAELNPLDVEYYIVVSKGTSVASTTRSTSKDSPAGNARDAHVEWEKRHGIDPDHVRGDNLA